MTGRPTVLFDLQATQSVDQRHRGIPRYVADLAFAIEEIDPGAVESYLVNPDLAVPEAHITERLVAAVRPDVYVKGADYAVKSLPERPVVEAYGGEVVLLPLEAGRSTSGLIAEIVERFGNRE